MAAVDAGGVNVTLGELFEVRPGEALLIEVWLADEEHWSPFTRHRYLLMVERGPGPLVHVETTLSDGMRHPLRR